MEPAFPVRSKVYARQVDGLLTNFVFNLYLDQLLLIITQLGTVGTVFSARQDATFDGHTTYTTTALLGKRDDPLLTTCARQIVEFAGAGGYTKPMIICLGLKESSSQSVKDMVAAVKEDNIWSRQ